MTVFQESCGDSRPARVWENHPLYAGDPTALIDENGEQVELNPNRQYWFIKRSYGNESAGLLTKDDTDRVFYNIPFIVRAPGFKAYRSFDAEGWLRTAYLWIKGHTQQELAEARHAYAPNISMGIGRLGNAIARQRTLAQVIRGELPDLPTPKIETEAEKRLKRSRKFLATSYSKEISMMLPDEVVSILASFALNLNGATTSEPTSQRLNRANRLSRWLGGETLGQIAADVGVSRQAVQFSIARDGARLVNAFPENVLVDFVDKIKLGEALPSEIGRIALKQPKTTTEADASLSGEVDLEEIGSEREIKIPRRAQSRVRTKKPSQSVKKKAREGEYFSTMTSAEFWKSPILPPRPHFRNKIKGSKQEKVSMPEVEGVEHRVIDGKVYRLTILKGFTRPAPIPEGQRVIDSEHLA